MIREIVAQACAYRAETSRVVYDQAAIVREARKSMGRKESVMDAMEREMARQEDLALEPNLR